MADKKKVVKRKARKAAAPKLSKAPKPAKAPKAPKAPKAEAPKQAAPEIHEVLTAEEQAQLTVWAQEKDVNGQLIRPWAFPGHPKHQVFVKTVEGIQSDPDLEGKSALEKMAETDRRMGVSRGTPRIAPVLSGGGSPNRGGKGPNLNNEQKAIAARMGVKPEAYAAMLADSTKSGAMNMSFQIDQ